jgi:DNA repair photolyase
MRQLPLFDEIRAILTLRDVANVVRETGTDGLTDATRRADQARYQEVRVRAALAQAVGMPFKWTLNPYRGCTHGCEYCYARKYQRHLDLGTGDDFSSLIFVKTNLVEALARDLDKPGWCGESVAIGTATDPYQPIEGHYKLTRRAVLLLGERANPFSIVTKGSMIVRDIDVLQQASRRADCRVFLSIPTVDEDAWRKLEPGTPSPAHRLRAVRELADAGIDAGVLMMPLVPGITTSRPIVERTLRAFADSGARFVGACVARLDPGVREHFMTFLEREYPALVDAYDRLYARNRADARYASDIKAMVATLANRVGVASGGDS